MFAVGIIPARMSSSRLPGKPLAKILGMPMLGHVFNRSKMSRLINDIYVATCDQEIAEYSSNIGAKCIMTSNSHERATDRTAEAMLKIEEETGNSIDLVVMIQGDEPMVFPDMIDHAVNVMRADSSLEVANLMAELTSVKEFEDPNEIKVVVDLEDNALYFSREAVPSRRKGSLSVPMLKQVCVIPFRREFLLRFNELPQTPLEIIESIDMMRVLENGGKLRMIRTPRKTWSVDTMEDLVFVENKMKDDPLVNCYIHKL